MKGTMKLVLLGLILSAGVVSGAALNDLDVLSPDRPAAFYFRMPESAAASGSALYEKWRDNGREPIFTTSTTGT